MRSGRLLAFICFVPCLVTLSSAPAPAQPAAKPALIGIIAPGPPPVAPIKAGLERRGEVAERDFVLKPLSAEGNVDRLPALVDELVAARADIVMTGGYPAARWAKERAGTIPVVAMFPGDPVATGLIETLARPGGHVTGVADFSPDLSVKRLQILKEAAPGIRTVAVLWNRDDRGMSLRYETAQAVAPDLGIALMPLGVREPADFGTAFAAMTRSPPDAILMVTDVLTRLNRQLIINFANERRIPSIFEYATLAQDGGLMTYGVSETDVFDRGAGLADRILRGAKPADLPFEQPTRFELVVNAKTAKTIGLALPPSLLARADKVIE